MVEELLLSLLVFHGVLGGVDVLFNHELVEGLPHRPGAGREEALHAAREALFAALFFSLAWFEWHGLLAWCIAAVVAAEIVVSTWDSVLEDRTRRLPAFERILHIALLINLGAYIMLLLPLLADWSGLPSGLEFRSHGWQSLALTALSIAAIAWCMRDAISSRRLAALPAPA
jgi:hypothetical protein